MKCLQLLAVSLLFIGCSSSHPSVNNEASETKVSGQFVVYSQGTF